MPSAALGVGGPWAAGTDRTFQPVTLRMAWPARAEPAPAWAWGSTSVATTAKPVKIVTRRPPRTLVLGSHISIWLTLLSFAINRATSCPCRRLGKLAEGAIAPPARRPTMPWWRDQRDQFCWPTGTPATWTAYPV